MDAPFTVATFNGFLQEKKLMASRCAICGALHLPPRAICPDCHGEQAEWVEVAGTGKLAAFTTIYIAPSAMIAQGYDRNNPYCSGIVELDEGMMVSARITGVNARDPGSIAIGMPLTVDFIEQGEGDRRTTVLAFRPT